MTIRYIKKCPLRLTFSPSSVFYTLRFLEALFFLDTAFWTTKYLIHCLKMIKIHRKTKQNDIWYCLRLEQTIHLLMIGYNICVIFPEESPTTVASNTTIVKMLCSLVSLNNKTVNRFSNLHKTLKTGNLIKMKNNICSIKKEEIDNLPHTWQLAVLGISYLFLVVFFFAPSCSLEGGSPWSPIQNMQRSYSR